MTNKEAVQEERAKIIIELRDVRRAFIERSEKQPVIRDTCLAIADGLNEAITVIEERGKS